MVRLYFNPGSANLAPHMLLKELGVAHELILVDQEKGMHRQPEYLKLNPVGRIPTLIDGDLVLFETAAICLHLVDCHPEAGFAPPVGSVERAHFYKWMMYLTNTVQAEMLTYFYPERLTDDIGAAAQVKARAEARIGAMFDLLEDELKRSGGPYLLGAKFTAVDPYLFMLSRWTRMMGNPARNRPCISRFQKLMLERPAVQQAFAAEGLGEPYV